MKQWPKTRAMGCPCHWTALVQLGFASQNPWVPMRVFPEIITGTVIISYWIISLTNFVVKHFQIKYKLKKKKK